MIREGFNASLGEIIIDQLYLNEMPTVELSVRLNLSIEETDKLINEELEVTPEIANGLEQVFNAPASFWMGFTRNEKVFFMEQA
jgi:plasmid maintenance system antidote protein VapI